MLTASHPTVIPRQFRLDPDGLAAHVEEERRALVTMTTDGLFPTDPLRAPVLEALHSLMARGYLLPAPPRLPSMPGGSRLDARGERVKRGAEPLPTAEALDATYFDEAVKSQHQLLCGYLGRGVHGLAEARAGVDFNGALWEAVVDFAKVVDVKPPGTLESLPIYAVELTRNGDRLPRRATVHGEFVGFAFWCGGRPSVGEIMAAAGSLPGMDWPVLALLSAKLRAAGAAVEAENPNAGWTDLAASAYAEVLVYGVAGSAKDGRRRLVATREIPAARRLGFTRRVVVAGARITTQVEAEALVEEEVDVKARSAGLPYTPTVETYRFIDGVTFNENAAAILAGTTLYPNHLHLSAFAAEMAEGLIVPNSMLTHGAPDHAARVMLEMGTAAVQGAAAFHELKVALDGIAGGTRAGIHVVEGDDIGMFSPEGQAVILEAERRPLVLSDVLAIPPEDHAAIAHAKLHEGLPVYVAAEPITAGDLVALPLGATGPGPHPVHKVTSDDRWWTAERLHVTLWSMQRLVLRLLETPNALVAVAAGLKVGKSMTAAVALTQWAVTMPKGRVVVVVDCEHRAQRLLDQVATLTMGATPPIDMEAFDATVALADDPEVEEFFTGIPDVPTLYVVDDANELPVHVYNMMMTALVGAHSDTRILMLGIPSNKSDHWSEGDVRCEGGMSGLWKAFHEDAERWKRVTVSSEMTPNFIAGRKLIPGLATREYVEEKRIEWGPDYVNDPRYQVRILGQFVEPTPTR